MKYLFTQLQKQFILRDLLIAGILSVILVLWIQFGLGEQVIHQMLDNNRAVIYGACTSLFGALLGFIITSASIVLNYADNPHLKLVRQSIFYPKIGESFIIAIRCLAFATLASLGDLFIDRDTTPHLPFTILCFIAIIFAVVTTIRTVFIFEQIIRITTKQQPLDTPSKPYHITS